MHQKLTRSVLLYSVLSITSCKTANTCNIDTDCPGDALCIDNVCKEGCSNDNDCPENQICENKKCTFPYIPPETPEQAWQSMKIALERNDPAAAIQYFSPHVQQKYYDAFSRPDLADLVRKIPSLPSNPTVPGSKFIQYELEIDDRSYAVTFNCAKGVCSIVSF